MNNHDTGKIRIAIVGSGIAGSAAAHFAREALGASAEIAVFERSRRIGGRVQDAIIDGLHIETGASLIHSSNRYLCDAIDLLGLHRTDGHETESAGGGSSSPFGIWDGRAFRLMASRSDRQTQLRMLVRYGLTLRKVSRLSQVAVGRFLALLYDLQATGRSFTTPEDLFRALGLYGLTQRSSYDFFRSSGVSQRFVREFANGVSRGNYGQDASMNAFVNIASLATAGFAGGSLFSVREGNNQVCRGLLRISGADVRTGYAVRRIEGDPSSNSASVRYLVTTEGGCQEAFDAVILATPLEDAGIEFRGIDLPPSARREPVYQTTYRTLVVGKIDPGYFGKRTPAHVPRFVMTMEEPDIPFSSLHVAGRTESGGTVYSMFSREEPSEQLLSEVFAERTRTERMCWRAYPVLEPLSPWPPFRLGSGLYYVNAMESAVSTMETEAMASRNAINLLVRDLVPTARLAT